MSKVKQFIRKHAKGLTAAMASFLAFALVMGLTVTKDAEAGWYPTRNIKNYSAGVEGFDVPTFNSFKGTNSYGDERTFYSAALKTSSKDFYDTRKVKPGDELILRTYFHNGAQESEAKNARVKFYIPSGTGTTFKSYSYISADNARYFNGDALVTKDGKPVVTVYDSVDLASDVPVSLEYIKGSARMYTHANDFSKGGLAISDAAVFTSGTVDPTKSTGAAIGYKSANGIVPGCFEFEGWVFVHVKVKGVPETVAKPELKVTKKVKVEGSSTWHDANDQASAVEAQKGDNLAYLIRFENTGNVKLTDVTIKDELPQGVTYTPGTTRFINSANPDPGIAKPDGVTGSGLNLGSFKPGEGGYIRFNAKAPSQLAAGKWYLTNVAIADSKETPAVKDKAVVFINVEEVPNPTPVPSVIEKAKSAFNATQGQDATLIVSHAGDVINYTLVTKNSGGEVANNVVVQDDLSDVLEYSEITDLGGSVMNGTVIKYPAVNIQPNQIVTNTFTVKVKPASSWPNGGDLKMTNVYGNTVDVPVGGGEETPTFGEDTPKGEVKTLPSTGPEDLAPVAGLFSLISLGYHYKRSRKRLTDAMKNKTY